jgi:hypothetical protein
LTGDDWGARQVGIRDTLTVKESSRATRVR